MAVAEGDIGFFCVAKMTVRLRAAVVHIIPFFEHGILRRRGWLPSIDLCSVGEQNGGCREGDLSHFDCWAGQRRREKPIIPIAISRSGSLLLELRKGVIE